VPEILLTIGVPTFNGEKYLLDTIDRCISQIRNNKINSVEIIISDNASTDSTQKIAELLRDTYPQLIKYYRNYKNIGFDRNIVEIFKKAKGAYVHILGDDDFYCDNSLMSVVSLVNNKNYLSVILLNIIYLDIKSNKLYGEYFIDCDQEFENGNSFFQFTKWRTSPISALIFNRADFNSLDLSKYYGNQWIHIGAIVEILAKGGGSYIISRKVITVRTGNIHWNNHFGNQLRVGIDHLKVLSEMLNLGYDKETYEYFYHYRLNTNISDIINLAPISFLERIKISQNMIFLFKTKAIFWFLHLPLLLLFSYPLQFTKIFAKHLLLNGKKLIKFTYK
jgi:glycosyltransferase involved in cell wall biosynthesis